MDWTERIVINPRTLKGQPIVRGTRHTVEHIVDLLAHGWTEAEILMNYADLEPEDIEACVLYAPPRG